MIVSQELRRRDPFRLAALGTFPLAEGKEKIAKSVKGLVNTLRCRPAL